MTFECVKMLTGCRIPHVNHFTCITGHLQVCNRLFVEDLLWASCEQDRSMLLWEAHLFVMEFETACMLIQIWCIENAVNAVKQWALIKRLIHQILSRSCCLDFCAKCLIFSSLSPSRSINVYLWGWHRNIHFTDSHKHPQNTCSQACLLSSELRWHWCEQAQ